MMLNIIFLIDLIGLIIAAPIYATNFDVNCGPNSLKGICNKFGLNTSIHKIQELSWFDTETGTTMFGLLRAANELKLPAVPLKISFNEFRKMNCPGIVFVDGNHFAIVWKLMKDRVVFQDWPDSCKYLTRKEFESEWRGDTIIFSRFYRWKNRKELSSLFGPFTGPKIMFNIKEKDKGDVKEGMELSYVFTFENIGSQPLTVETRPSCSCIRAVLSEKKIAPGKIGKITVLFDTNGLSGPQKKGIHVMSNDPDNRVINIFLSGNIKAFAKVIPSKLWIGRVVSGNIIKKKFDVYIPAGTTFSIYKIKTDDGIQVKMNKEKIENGNTIIPFSLSMNIFGPIGGYSEKVKLFTNEPNKIIEVPIEGEIVGPIEANPSMIYLGEIKHDMSFDRRIALRPIIETVGSKHSDLNLEVKNNVKGTTTINAFINKNENELELLVTGITDKKSEIIEGSFDIFNENSEKILSVPIYGVAKK